MWQAPVSVFLGGPWRAQGPRDRGLSFASLSSDTCFAGAPTCLLDPGAQRGEVTTPRSPRIQTSRFPVPKAILL